MKALEQQTYEKVVLSVHPLDGDKCAAGFKEFEDKFVTARKDHPCSCCANIIPRGARYRSFKGVDEADGFLTTKYCRKCQDRFLDVADLEAFKQTP